MKNYEHLYSKELDKTIIILNNIRELGIDVSSLESEFESLLNNDFSTSKSEFQMQFDFKEALNNLKSFQKELEKYNLIFQVKNSISYLNTFIDNGVNSDNIDNCSNEILKTFKRLKDVDVITLIKCDEVLDSFYKTAYNVIKLEFIYKDKSKVLNYILNDKSCISKINELIKMEFQELSNSINDIKGLNKLKLVMSKMNKSGLSSNYVNEDVFKCLVVCTDSDIVKTNTIKTLEELGNKLRENIENIKSKEKRISVLDEEINDVSLSKNKKIIRKRLLSLILSGTILGGICLGIVKSKKQDCYVDKYYTRKTTYSSYEDNPIKSEEYLEKIEDDYQVTLEIENKIEEGFLGTIDLKNIVYDVTDYIPEDFNFRALLDVDKLGLLALSSEMTQGLWWWNDDNVPDYTGFKYTISSQNPDKKITEFNEDGYEASILLFTIIFLVSFVAFNFGYLDNEKIIGELNTCLMFKKDNKKKKKELEKILVEVNKILNSNTKLKLKFMKIWENKEDLLNEEYEMLLKDNFDVDFKESEELKLRYKK